MLEILNDMSKNAISILNDEDKLNEFKQNAKEVASRFDIIKILPMYEKIYEEAIEMFKQKV